MSVSIQEYTHGDKKLVVMYNPKEWTPRLCTNKISYFTCCQGLINICQIGISCKVILESVLSKKNSREAREHLHLSRKKDTKKRRKWKVHTRRNTIGPLSNWNDSSVQLSRHKVINPVLWPNTRTCCKHCAAELGWAICKPFYMGSFIVNWASSVSVATSGCH